MPAAGSRAAMTPARRRRILFIGGSLNQTSMLHAVASHLGHHEYAFTPYYLNGMLDRLSRLGWLDFTVAGVGGPHRQRSEAFLRRAGVTVDERGVRGRYDLVVTSSDLVIQRNIRDKRIVLVQEGMTDPETFLYHVVRTLRLPRWLASTATTGLSLAYDRFCVASDGYRDLFVRKGAPADRIVVTGIPNFDDCARHLRNDFPHRDYVMVATSDARETLKRDRRARFLAEVERIAAGRPLLFKLHPNENVERSTAEIRARFPNALVYADGDTNHMIANCRVLITQYSSVVYVGLALGKECHSYFDLAQLRRLVPVQNGGTSARAIAGVCEAVLEQPAARAPRRQTRLAS